MNKANKSILDRIGIGASLACAVHCILFPLLFTTLPLFGFEVMHNWKIEVLLIFVSFVIGNWALYHGYKKHHHRFWILPAFLIGLSLVIAGNFMIKEWLDMLLKFFGAGLIIVAHIFNLKYNKRCSIHPMKKEKTIMYHDLKQIS